MFFTLIKICSIAIIAINTPITHALIYPQTKQAKPIQSKNSPHTGMTNFLPYFLHHSIGTNERFFHLLPRASFPQSKGNGAHERTSPNNDDERKKERKRQEQSVLFVLDKLRRVRWVQVRATDERREVAGALLAAAEATAASSLK